MASCQTSQWVSTSPYVKLTVTQTSSTEIASTLTWTLQYISSSAASTSVAKSYTVTIDGTTVKTGTYSINGKTGTNTIATGTKTISKGTSARNVPFSVSFAFNLTWSGSYKGTLSANSSISVPAKTSYKITYNANGGSGAPSAQTKWYGGSVTISSTKPTRTGYSFKGWGITASTITVYLLPGESYSDNKSITLYAIWQAHTYVVSYNANGGANAPANQTKTYGKALTLWGSAFNPTRTNYTFKGWGTSASATTVAYAPGASYTANSAVTLYAVWSLAYVKPRLFNLLLRRCDSSGTVKDDGTNGLVTLDFECDTDVTSVVIKWKQTSATTWTSATATASGTDGTINYVVGSNALDTGNSYDIHITVSDSGGSSYIAGILSSMIFPVDFLAGGKGVAFGKAAELEDTAEFEFDAKFNGPVYGNALGMNRLPEIPANSDLNNYMDTGCYAVYKNDNAATISNIPIDRAGRLEVWSATGEGIRSEQWSYLKQRYIPYNIANATWEREITRSSDNVWTYGTWYRTTLTPTASEYVYNEYTQKILWGEDLSSGMYMVGSHTIQLSEAVSAQRHGIVLVFSYYNGVDDTNFNYQSFFVPKRLVALTGSGHTFTMTRSKYSSVGSKYLYIRDKSIQGHADNESTGTANGVTYANNKFVLRWVIGV